MGGSSGQSTNNILSQDPKKLYSFQTLPEMESAVGQQPAAELLEEILADEKKDVGSHDYGCICEIDLT